MLRASEGHGEVFVTLAMPGGAVEVGALLGEAPGGVEVRNQNLGSYLGGLGFQGLRFVVPNIFRV